MRCGDERARRVGRATQRGFLRAARAVQHRRREARLDVALAVRLRERVGRVAEIACASSRRARRSTIDVEEEAVLEAIRAAPVDAKKTRQERAIEHAIDVDLRDVARAEHALFETKPEERRVTEHALGVRLVVAEPAEQIRNAPREHGAARARDELVDARASRRTSPRSDSTRRPSSIHARTASTRTSVGSSSSSASAVATSGAIEPAASRSETRSDAVSGGSISKCAPSARRFEEPFANRRVLRRSAAERPDDEHARAFLFEQTERGAPSRRHATTRCRRATGKRGKRATPRARPSPRCAPRSSRRTRARPGESHSWICAKSTSGCGTRVSHFQRARAFLERRKRARRGGA